MTVYFMAPVGGGNIKIGSSRWPADRLKIYQAWSPMPLELLAQSPGGHAEEAIIHRRFHEHRLHHEWFSPAPEILALIEDVRALNCLPGGVNDPPPTFMRGDDLIGVLEAWGINQSRLARGIGLTRQAVSLWKRAGKIDPSWRRAIYQYGVYAGHERPSVAP